MVFIDYTQEAKDDIELIDSFKKLTPIATSYLSDEEINNIVAALKTGVYTAYDKLVVNECNFTFDNQKLDNEKIRFTLKSELKK